MRDLTPDELALAPDWATHYYSDFPEGHFVKVCFVNDKKAVNLLSSGEFGAPYPNEVGIGSGDKLIVKPQAFDITQHEWESGDFVDVFKAYADDVHLHFFIAPYCQGRTWISKNDAIAIAKHFNLTVEDLK